ncbi:MAG: flagellar hook protein FlgE [Sulfuriflexus sp.]|nr:flagellar hook protein FlgE [Sulfuriflexus sp.]
MPFRTALSGLNAASAELRVIGNNVANAATTGFKKSRAEFADIFATSNLGVSSNAIGSGVRVASVSQQFSQGNIGFTDNNLDLSISGQGFFILNDNGIASYSRAGQFGVDRNGFVVNPAGSRLTIFQADAAGNVTGAQGDLQLDTADIAPQATTTLDFALNLDASSAIPAGATTSNVEFGGTPLLLNTITATGTTVNSNPFTLYDNNGTAVPNSTVRFTSTTTAGTWNVELRPGGNAAVPPAIQNNVIIGAAPDASVAWDPDGTGSQPSVPVNIDTSAIGAGASAIAAASSTQTQGAFDVTNANTYNSSTSLTIFDSLGSSHLATTYYRKTPTPNQWETYLFVDGSQVDGPSSLDFSAQGTIVNPTAPSQIPVTSFAPSGGAANLALTLDYADATQYGSNFSVNSLVQNGFTTGRLSGIDIADSGIITSRFTNGQSRTIGQVALANFASTQGLRQLGDTSWAESFESGAALVSAPGSGSLGTIQSGALEGSNVDLTEQLVQMITTQRNFQANAQVITTADTITQTIINI